MQETAACWHSPPFLCRFVQRFVGGLQNRQNEIKAYTGSSARIANNPPAQSYCPGYRTTAAPAHRDAEDRPEVVHNAVAVIGHAFTGEHQRNRDGVT